MKLNEDQIIHLIDLLQRNIQEKKERPHRLMTKEMIDDAIAFDAALIEVLEDEVKQQRMESHPENVENQQQKCRLQASSIQGVCMFTYVEIVAMLLGASLVTASLAYLIKNEKDFF